MPQQEENLESQQQQEELDITEQLDVLLEELREIEPDLMPGWQMAEPEAIALPQVEELSETVTPEPEPSVTAEAPSPSEEALEPADSPAEVEPSEVVAESVEPEPSEDAILPEPAIDLGAALDDILAEAEAEEDASEEEVQPVAIEEAIQEEVSGGGEADLADQLQSLLSSSEATEEAEATAEDVSEEEVQPVAIEEATQEEASGGGEADLADQLQSLLSSSEATEETEEVVDVEVAEETPPPAVQAEPVAVASPDAVAPVAEVETEIEQLSMEQIDQLLAEEAVDPEADSELADLLEMPTETVVQSEVVVEEAVSVGQPVEEAAASNGPEDGGGFDADSASVAKELDDQPELSPALTANATSDTDQGDQARRIRFKLDKQALVISAWACERLLRRTCMLMNSPLRRLPPTIRDAVGVAAFFHLLVGSVLIFGKLVGAI